MSEKVMVALVGEQPIPNLLGIRQFSPDWVLLVDTKQTEQVSARLQPLISCGVRSVSVSPYDINGIHETLADALDDSGWSDSATFNLTGGTKTMVMAAYDLARENGRPFFYVQSNVRNSVTHHYAFEDSIPRLVKSDTVPILLTIDDYLRAYVGSYRIEVNPNPFEEQVYAALCDEVDESVRGVKHGESLEIDLVLRSGNHVAILEAKTGNKARSRDGIDQLTMAAEPRFLGTYTGKVYVLDRPYPHGNRKLALERGIEVIELCSAQSGELSPADKDTLVSAVRRKLGLDR